ncbi:hypothetical protein GCM10012289_09240 [Nonomuraea cavernae]|uniref:Uncharacterized protein n=1 Tax=Nonomuraea cavernae TaxID=2045107 RepID=A0A917YPE3_9ACTN|nr:hypothetical protein GCM10012289_09240 [Nonomuraea cavernae]
MIELGAVAAISALVAAGCADEVTADCVLVKPQPDGSYVVVDERLCNSSSGSHSAYVLRYGGHRAGTVLRGGTTVRPKNSRIVTRQGTIIQRGGFGKSATTGKGGGG